MLQFTEIPGVSYRWSAWPAGRVHRIYERKDLQSWRQTAQRQLPVPDAPSTGNEGSSFRNAAGKVAKQRCETSNATTSPKTVTGLPVSVLRHSSPCAFLTSPEASAWPLARARAHRRSLRVPTAAIPISAIPSTTSQMGDESSSTAPAANKGINAKREC